MESSISLPNANDNFYGAWSNSYVVPPAPQDRFLAVDELYGSTPYDVNFCFPYIPEALESHRIKIVPFIPRLHAEGFFLHASTYPDDFKHMRFPIPRTMEEMLAWFEHKYRRDPGNMAYAIMFADDTGKNWSYGAILCLTGCDPERLFAEVAMGIGFRSHTGRNGAAIATGMLIRYCMNLPTDSPPGLGLRKLGWTAHAGNYPAHGLAASLGFRVESMQRRNRMAPPGKANNRRVLRKGDPSGVPGIDDYYLTLCWDDWEANGKTMVEACMARTFTSKKKARL